MGGDCEGQHPARGGGHEQGGHRPRAPPRHRGHLHREHGDEPGPGRQVQEGDQRIEHGAAVRRQAQGRRRHDTHGEHDGQDQPRRRRRARLPPPRRRRILRRRRVVLGGAEHGERPAHRGQCGTRGLPQLRQRRIGRARRPDQSRARGLLRFGSGRLGRTGAICACRPRHVGRRAGTLRTRSLPHLGCGRRAITLGARDLTRVGRGHRRAQAGRERGDAAQLVQHDRVQLLRDAAALRGHQDPEPGLLGGGAAAPLPIAGRPAQPAEAPREQHDQPGAAGPGEVDGDAVRPARDGVGGDLTRDVRDGHDDRTTAVQPHEEREQRPADRSRAAQRERHGQREHQNGDRRRRAHEEQHGDLHERRDRHAVIVPRTPVATPPPQGGGVARTTRPRTEAPDRAGFLPFSA